MRDDSPAAFARGGPFFCSESVKLDNLEMSSVGVLFFDKEGNVLAPPGGFYANVHALLEERPGTRNQIGWSTRLTQSIENTTETARTRRNMIRLTRHANASASLETPERTERHHEGHVVTEAHDLCGEYVDVLFH